MDTWYFVKKIKEKVKEPQKSYQTYENKKELSLKQREHLEGYNNNNQKKK